MSLVVLAAGHVRILGTAAADHASRGHPALPHAETQLEPRQQVSCQSFFYLDGHDYEIDYNT